MIALICLWIQPCSLHQLHSSYIFFFFFSLSLHWFLVNKFLTKASHWICDSKASVLIGSSTSFPFSTGFSFLEILQFIWLNLFFMIFTNFILKYFTVSVKSGSQKFLLGHWNFSVFCPLLSVRYQNRFSGLSLLPEYLLLWLGMTEPWIPSLDNSNNQVKCIFVYKSCWTWNPCYTPDLLRST